MNSCSGFETHLSHDFLILAQLHWSSSGFLTLSCSQDYLRQGKDGYDVFRDGICECLSPPFSPFTFLKTATRKCYVAAWCAETYLRDSWEVPSSIFSEYFLHRTRLSKLCEDIPNERGWKMTACITAWGLADGEQAGILPSLVPRRWTCVVYTIWILNVGSQLWSWEKNWNPEGLQLFFWNDFQCFAICLFSSLVA